jgi:hypothetical protein
MFHKHNWNLIDKTVIAGLPAILDRVTKIDGGPDMIDALRVLAQGYVVLVFKCDCGKIRTEVK